MTRSSCWPISTTSSAVQSRISQYARGMSSRCRLRRPRWCHTVSIDFSPQYSTLEPLGRCGRRNCPMQELAPYTMRLTFPAEHEATSVIIEPLVRDEERLSLWDCWWIIVSHLRLIVLFFGGTVLATGLVIL